jgi:OTU domain-containing protein 6
MDHNLTNVPNPHVQLHLQANPHHLASNMEELLARHRKEQRDLQSRITQKKKSASKKTRKGVNDECEKLERELKERQAAEIAALSVQTDLNGVNDTEKLAQDSISGEEETNNSSRSSPAQNEKPQEDLSNLSNGVSNLSLTSSPPQQQQRKPSRQKARLARRAAELASIAAQAAEESLSLPDLRKREKDVMNSEFQRRGLHEKEVKADGHCLYAAIADGLKFQGLELRPIIQPTIIDGEEEKIEDYRVVRKTAAEYIKANQGDFVPFLEEPLDEYVTKVGETGEWGGQLELLALAKAYGIDIAVLQGDGNVVSIEGGGKHSRKLWLAYYKHGFGLGEHYNSLRKAG